MRVAYTQWCDRVSQGREGYWGEITTMIQHNDSRPSYLLVGLVEGSELRELLDEVYLYALEPSIDFTRT